MLDSTKKLYKRKGGKKTSIEKTQSIKLMPGEKSVMKKAETAFEASNSKHSNEKIAFLESLDSDLSQELPLIRSQDFDKVKIKRDL